MNGPNKLYKDKKDCTLVEMTLLGNESAYEELVTRHEKSVRGTAYKVTGNRYSAEDASQDAFVSAWMKLDTLREKEKFGSWVCSIAKNCAKSIVTHYGCAAADISLDLLVYDDEENENSEINNILDLARRAEDDQKEKLRDVVDGLSEKIREAVKLHYFEELSVAEIADKLSLPVGTVKWRLSEGRKLLRKEYGVMEKDYDENENIVRRVMRQVELLKAWGRKNDRSGFEKEYRKTLADVESLKNSKEKSHALADVLLRGAWWIPGERNEEIFKRIKAEAIAGHNDDVMQSVMAREAGEYKNDERIEYMLSVQVPFLREHGFVKSLGYIWFWVGWEYANKNDTERAVECFNNVTEVLTPEDVYYANALSAIEAERFRSNITGKHNKHYSGGATGEVYKYANGKLLFWSQPGYSFGWAAVEGKAVFWNAGQNDGIIYDENMSAGDVYTSTDGLCTLTYRENGVTVETPAGVFKDCQVWVHEGMRYGLDYCETYICPDIGIVKQRSSRYDTEATWVLNKYSLSGGKGLIPFEKGNRWEYVYICDKGEKYDTISYFEVTSYEKGSAVVTSGHRCVLEGFDTSTWDGEMSFLSNCFFRYEDEKEKMVDVRDRLNSVEGLATTKREKAITRVFTDVMRRVQNCYPYINPDYTEKGKWNYFSAYLLQEQNGKHFTKRTKGVSKYNFQWKANMWNIGNEGYKVLYGNFLHEIQDAVGCFWSDEWVSGYKKQAKSRIRDKASYTLAVLDDETVETPCGIFENCRHVQYELTGTDDHGWQFLGGKKDIWYAEGIGIVKFRTDYWYDRSLTCEWELKEYRKKGEGYFPVVDGGYRRYAPTTIGDGWHAGVEHTYDVSEKDAIIIINVLGTRDRARYEADEENKDPLYQ
ncbi:MAG: RNA polymerase sigma factor [Clostridia bacterium]|nr:RNA polymerase sigma factor [Clostridia bacterium]